MPDDYAWVELDDCMTEEDVARLHNRNRKIWTDAGRRLGMEDLDELAADARAHLADYDIEKLEPGSWPLTMRGLLEQNEKLRAALATVRKDTLLIDWGALVSKLEAERDALQNQKAAAWDEGGEAAYDRLRQRVQDDGMIDQHTLLKKPKNPYRG